MRFLSLVAEISVAACPRLEADKKCLDQWEKWPEGGGEAGQSVVLTGTGA